MDQETVDVVVAVAGDAGVGVMRGAGEFIRTTDETRADEDHPADARRVCVAIIRKS